MISALSARACFDFLPVPIMSLSRPPLLDGWVTAKSLIHGLAFDRFPKDLLFASDGVLFLT